ncbi:MAG: DUF3592 domain-containing protein [Acidobacteria bacterium]|nr:DUF3592 domain-containing protein [Acidobacteriota bacterium]
MTALRILAITLISSVIVFGLVIFGIGVRNVWRAWASNRWPAVPGVVLESSTSSSVSRDSKTGVASTSYQAQITFGYRVNGRAYATDTIHFGQTTGSGDSSDMELRRLRYPQGSAVSVSYAPQDPSLGAVKPGIYPEVFWMLGAGLAFVLPAVAGLLFFLTSEMNLPGFAIGLSLFAMIFCMIGAVMLYWGSVRLWHAHASQRWPVTAGVIVFQKQDESTSAERREDGSLRKSTSYATDLVYQYDVGGTTHFANVRRFGQLAGASQDWADEIADRYPPGAKVKVAYDPSDPDLAVLEPGIISEAWWLPGAGAAFLLFGLAALKWGVPALS